MLSIEKETLIIDRLILASKWGYPLDVMEICLFGKHYLDVCGRRESRFRNNLPGRDWAVGFLASSQILTKRMATNVKRCRGEVDHKTVEVFFDHLEISTNGVPLENIVNYDETNMTDDPWM